VLEGCVDQNVDVPVVTLTGTIAGVGGAVVLVQGSDRVTLRPDTSGSYSTRIVPGVYDVVYEYGPGETLFESGVTVSPGITNILDLAPPNPVALSGRVSLNGAPVTEYQGKLWLDGGRGIGLIETTADGSFSVDVIPGTYDVLYMAYPDGSGALIGPEQLAVARGVSVESSAINIDVDIPLVGLSGSLTINGADVVPGSPDSDAWFGTVYLIGEGGDMVELDYAPSPEYSVTLVPGAYDVYCLGTRIMSAVEIPAGADTVLNIDVPTVVVSGSVDRSALEGSDFGAFFLRDTSSGQDFFIAHTTQDTYSQNVFPGTYDLFYSGPGGASGPAVDPASGVPKNTFVILETGLVIESSGTTTLDIDLPVATVTGKFTIAGSELSSEAGRGELFLAANADDQIRLDLTNDSHYTVAVVAGSYDVYYKWSLIGAVAPRNTRGKVLSQVMVAPGVTTTLDVDVPSAPIAGSLTVAGMNVGGLADTGAITLRNSDGDEVELGTLDAAMYSFGVIPGTYEAFYSGTTLNTFAPINTDAKLGCFVVR
jgi:hypothetical protein